MKKINFNFNGGVKYFRFAEILTQFPTFLIMNLRGAFYVEESK